MDLNSIAQQLQSLASQVQAMQTQQDRTLAPAAPAPVAPAVPQLPVPMPQQAAPMEAQAAAAGRAPGAALPTQGQPDTAALLEQRRREQAQRAAIKADELQSQQQVLNARLQAAQAAARRV